MDEELTSRVWSREQLERITNLDREKFMPRTPVLAALEPGQGQAIADVGAGLGWLSFPIAEHVGSRGKVFALEPSAEAVAELTRRAAQQKLAQLVAIETFAEHLPLADQSVDGVIWHTVALMMGDRRQALSESFRIVRPGGRLVVVDWKIIETPSGPPLERRVPEDLLAEEARAQGFTLKGRFDPGPVTWGLVFQR